MLFRSKQENNGILSTENSLFDYRNVVFLGEYVLKEYLLQGKLKSDSNYCFLLFSDKDTAGKNLSFSFSAKELSSLISNQKSDLLSGINFGSFPNHDILFEKSQWFSAVTYSESTIFSSVRKPKIECQKDIYIVIGNIEYSLKIDRFGEMSGSIVHYKNLMGLHDAGPFQYDKLYGRNVLFSDVTSTRLDELIRELYVDKLNESNR